MRTCPSASSSRSRKSNHLRLRATPTSISWIWTSYGSAGPPVPVYEVMGMVGEMKRRRRRVFESLIKPKAREIFDAD